jgi:hypothetical protein
MSALAACGTTALIAFETCSVALGLAGCASC